MRNLHILFLCLMLAITQEVLATHIVGGEIYYRKLTGNTYEITLKVYRDCSPVNVNGTYFDEEASVGIFRDGLLIQNLLMPLWDAEISVVPVQLENPCFVLPPNVCVEEAIYIQNVTLQPHPSGYQLVHQRCCRNPSIINIQFPDDSGATFWTQIPSSNITTENSNPVFNNLPPVALCTGAEFVFDHGATDLDGDSLVYSFCTPLLGGQPDFPMPSPPAPPPFVPISWAGGFNQNYPLTSNPAFQIDPQTGVLSGTATQPGQFVIGICVAEYRNGILLSTTNRDFQFNVTFCEPNVVVTIPEQTQFCDGLTFSFSQNSTNADSFFWDFGDPSTDDDWSTLPNPTYTYADTGMYTVTLIANPGWTCADTVSTLYAAYPEIIPVIFQEDFTCSGQTGLYDFQATGDYGEDATFLWDFGPNAVPSSSTLQNPQNIALPPEVTFTVSLTVFENGCENTNTETIVQPPAPVAGIAEQESFCTGLTFSFENTSSNATQFLWDFGLPGNDDLSSTISPQFTYLDTGQYLITLTANAPGACPDVTTTSIDVYWLLDAFFIPPPGQCFANHAFNFSGEGTVESTAVYSWVFAEGANISTANGPNVFGVSWDEPGTYDVELTVAANGCVDSITHPVTVLQDPSIDFIGSGAACPPFPLYFDNESFTATSAQYVWDFGDGTSSTQANPTHTYMFSGTFDVSLTMTTTGDCAQTLFMTVPNAVVAYPIPSAGFNIEPNTVNILEPHISITNLSEGGLNCLYNFGDGSTSTEWNPDYSYVGSGYFDVIQTVTNSYGCVDRAIGRVAVEGTLFYAPNAFTPDQDGINDVWQMVVTGYSRFQLEIYNRWGEVIFTTDDPNIPWIGNVKNGDHYAQNGIYVYRGVIHDLLGFPHEFEGHINLVR